MLNIQPSIVRNELTLDDIKGITFDVMQKNQYIFNLKDCQMFYSYKTIIAVKYDDGTTVLDSQYWDYSRTTGKYRNMFLGEDKRQTEKKIKSGQYLLKELN